MLGAWSIAHAADPKPPPLVLPPLSPLTAPEASLSPLRLDPVDLTRVERRARYKRNIGIGLSVPGVTLIVLGAVLIGAGAHDDRLVAGAAEIASGAVATGIGVVFTIPGALLWVSGQDDLDLSAWRRRTMVPP
jgi:hypothetical protein